MAHRAAQKNGKGSEKTQRRVRLSGKSGELYEPLKDSEYEYIYGNSASKFLHRIDTEAADKSIYDRAETNPEITRTKTKKFIDADERNARARQLKATYDLIISDLGGIDNVTLAQSEVARRAATMAVIGQEMESSFVRNDLETFDFDSYIVVSRAQMSLFRVLGIERKKKDADGGGDTLDQYMQSKKKYENWKEGNKKK
jgi:hypothetical protein